MTQTAFSTTPGKASTVKTTFSRATSIRIDIEAEAAIVWALLTNAADYPRWNTTVIRIEGDIVLGGRIRLTSTLAPKRVFKLRVKEFQPERRLVWGDGQGTRVYAISPNGKGVTFTMEEKIGGLMFPLYAKYIPSFDQSFEQFAHDLKKEAEAI
jgi:uncharacterized protein YndB with AHSA1/START domain